jgi:ABC-type multidrug transport system ATPase subunit
LCHSVGILKGGRLIQCGPAAELLAHSAAAPGRFSEVPAAWSA